MGDLAQRFPWEQVPVATETAPLPATTEETVAALQRDFAYAVQCTAVLVHSEHEALCMLVNTARGQIIPKGQCKFADGTAFELQDIGMPQPGAPLMTVRELLTKIWGTARDLGLELRV